MNINIPNNLQNFIQYFIQNWSLPGLGLKWKNDSWYVFWRYEKDFHQNLFLYILQSFREEFYTITEMCPIFWLDIVYGYIQDVYLENKLLVRFLLGNVWNLLNEWKIRRSGMSRPQIDSMCQYNSGYKWSHIIFKEILDIETQNVF